MRKIHKVKGERVIGNRLIVFTLTKCGKELEFFDNNDSKIRCKICYKPKKAPNVDFGLS